MNIRHQINFFAGWLLTVEIRPFMAILGLFTGTWGAWLLMPWVDTFESSIIYNALAIAAPETVWGIAMVGVGFGQVYHSLHPIRRGAMLSSMAAVAIWTFIASAFLVSARLTTAIPVYVWVATWNGWLVYRVRGERERHTNGYQ